MEKRGKKRIISMKVVKLSTYRIKGDNYSKNSMRTQAFKLKTDIVC